MGQARGDARRLKTLINSVHAVIAFYHFAGLGIPLGSTPWAGGDAGFTPHTQILVNKNDAVFASALHGTGWTGCNTPGIFTVEAGHEKKRCPGLTVNEFRPHRDDLTGVGPIGQLFIAFALNFTGMAANTFPLVLQYKIFTHFFSPNSQGIVYSLSWV